MSNRYQTEGTVKVTRDYWWEIWLDPNGREVKGERAASLRKTAPARVSAARHERTKALAAEVSRLPTRRHSDATVKTDAKARPNSVHARARRLLSRRLAEQSGLPVKRDRFLPPIKAETYVFVATNAPATWLSSRMV
jgi:hypothetical protein